MIHETIHIAASADRVWRHLSDPDRMPAWMPGIRRMRALDEGGLRTGSRLVFSTGSSERRAEVAALEPGRSITLTASDGRFTLTYRYRLAAVEGGSAVSLDAECAARGLTALLAPLLRARIRKADRWQLAYLKGVVEKERDAEI